MLKPQEYIRNIANHYPDSDSIRRILQYASVDIINLDLEGKPLNTWFMALKEVVSQNRLPELIQTLSAEYPDLKIDGKDQQELRLFVSKKLDSTFEKPGFFRGNKSNFLKIVFVFVLIALYFVLSNILNESPDPKNGETAIKPDTTVSGTFEFVTLVYNDEKIDFPANKNILSLKQFILTSKEGLTDIDPAKTKLSFLGKVLADDLIISHIKGIQNQKIELSIDQTAIRNNPGVDIFLLKIKIDDPIIFVEDQAGFVTGIYSDRTRLKIPKYLGDHNLEIYFKDSLSVIPIHMEYSTSSISITSDEFRKHSRVINKVPMKPIQ